MELKKYDITLFFGDSRTIYPRDNIDEDVKNILCSIGEDARIIEYPGYEKDFNQKIDVDSCRFIVNFPPIANIPARVSVVGVESVTNGASPYFKDARFGDVADIFFEDMIRSIGALWEEKGYLWDERSYYRFVAMNEFINTEETMTFREFLSNKKTKIDELFMNSSSTYYDSTSDIMSFTETAGLLSFRENSITEDLILSMTADEVKRLMESQHNDRYDYVDSQFFDDEITEVLSDGVDKLRGSKKTKELKKARDNLMRALVTSIGVFGTGNVTYIELVEDLIKNSYIFETTVMKEQKIALSEEICKIADKITPVEIISLLFSVTNDNQSFVLPDDTNALDLFMKLFSLADTKEDFVSLISQMVLDYNGQLPCGRDWQENMDLGINDYSLGANLFMDLIINSSRGERTIVSDLAWFREKYSCGSSD